MAVPSLLEEPGRVDEPQAAQEYAAVLTRVVTAGRPVIVRRNGEDLAAVVPLVSPARKLALNSSTLIS
jgi:hypothetical protein